MEQIYHVAINWLDRCEIVRILEENGFTCYNNETTNDLRDALKENIIDGTISKHVIKV